MCCLEKKKFFNAYTTSKEEKFKISDLNFYLKKPEEEQIKPNVRRR